MKNFIEREPKDEVEQLEHLAVQALLRLSVARGRDWVTRRAEVMLRDKRFRDVLMLYVQQPC